MLSSFPVNATTMQHQVSYKTFRKVLHWPWRHSTQTPLAFGLTQHCRCDPIQAWGAWAHPLGSNKMDRYIHTRFHWNIFFEIRNMFFLSWGTIVQTPLVKVGRPCFEILLCGFRGWLVTSSFPSDNADKQLQECWKEWMDIRQTILKTNMVFRQHPWNTDNNQFCIWKIMLLNFECQHLLKQNRLGAGFTIKFIWSALCDISIRNPALIPVKIDWLIIPTPFTISQGRAIINVAVNGNGPFKRCSLVEGAGLQFQPQRMKFIVFTRAT